MSAAAYSLTVRPTAVSHGLGFGSRALVWLGDYDEGPDEREAREFNHIDAMAASGDCFITVATRLDKIAQGLLRDSAEQIELEHLVKMLFYLQDHWALAAKARKD